MSTQAGTLELIRDAMVALEIPAGDITPSARLADDLDVDSTELVELAASITRQLGVAVNSKALKDVATVSDLEALLERLRAAT